MSRQILLRDGVQPAATAMATGSLWNTGNYFFLDAVQRQLRFDDVAYTAATLPEADTLVLSMSNFIAPTTDMSVFADAIERRNYRKVVMIGAGAQAERFEERIELTPGTLRFLRLLSERSHSIGVRGFYTADILDDHGIRNVHVIGCPTLFWRMDPGFRIEKSALLPAAPRISVNSTPNGKYRDKLSMLYGAAVAAGAQYIGQTEGFLPLFGDKAEGPRNFFSRYYCDGSFAPAQLAALAAQAIHFTSIPEWIEHMRSFDFVVGGRFHGNMAALQAGVPAVTLLTDSRTKELCEFLNLPSVNLADCTRVDFREMYEGASYDMFNATFAQKYDNYVDFLRQNGIIHLMPVRTDSVRERPVVHRTGSKQGNYGLSALVELMEDARRAGFDDATRLGERAFGMLSELRHRMVGDAVERGELELQRLQTDGRESRAMQALFEKTASCGEEKAV